MQKPNLIIYESMMEIFEDFCEDGDNDLAIEYMLAIFNYYRAGEVYNGKSKEIKRQMKNIYTLIDKQQENFIKKVEKVISNEDFSALALSGNFSTQKELAEYITAHYGEYSQSAVSKRLNTLGITLVKPSSKSVSSASSAVENKIRESYNIYIESWGLKDSDAKQKVMKEYNISSADVERVLGGK